MITEKPAAKKRPANDFDFCPKHPYAFISRCGCGKKKKKEESEEIFPVDTLPFGDNEKDNA